MSKEFLVAHKDLMAIVKAETIDEVRAAYPCFEIQVFDDPSEPVQLDSIALMTLNHTGLDDSVLKRACQEETPPKI